MNISEQQLNNMMIAVTTALQPLIRALPVTPVEWADQNYYLPKESSYGEGEWKTLPFQVAIMNSMGHDRIRTVNLIKSARVGYTKMLLGVVGYEKQLAQEGVDITLIYSGQHKVDGNSIQALPTGVRADFQRRIDEARRMFVDKVALYTGLSSEVVMNTEAAVYDGQAGIDTGLADQLINAADAVDVMVSALNDSVTQENTMTTKNLTVAEAVS
ncbi:TPA: S49 family peptidase, partial [Escherichia coli]|nr:S49 family peptidase [Escherichia coli]